MEVSSSDSSELMDEACELGTRDFYAGQRDNITAILRRLRQNRRGTTSCG